MIFPTEKELKAMAYQMKLLNPSLKIGHCYETIAKTYGFRTYAAMRQALKEHRELH